MVVAALEGASTGDATVVALPLARVGGRSAGAGSLPIREGGPSCDSAVPTRRGLVVDADAPVDGAAFPAGCDDVVRDSANALACSAVFLSGCTDVPGVIDPAEFADGRLAASAEPSAGWRAFTANDLS